MMQMYDDGPTIEEILDNHHSGGPITAETIFKEDFDDVSKQIKTLTRDGSTKNADNLKQIISIMSRSIDKWAEDEDMEGSIRMRKDAIEAFTKKRNEFREKITHAEDEYMRRKRQRMDEEALMREDQRGYFSSRDNDMARHAGGTALDFNYQQGTSSNYRARYYSSDEDYENAPRSDRDRYRYPDSPQKSNQLATYHQRRDVSYSPSRSHQPMNGASSSTQVRMRAGKSRVTKKNSRKFRPGQKALAEIRQYQKSTDLLIQKAPFARLVHEIIREETAVDDFRVRADALLALQEAAEAFMVEMFEGSVLICNHAKRVTLMPADVQLYRRLCLRNL